MVAKIQTPKQEAFIKDALIIVDEISMLDSRLAYQLFAAIDSSCKVVLCGDDEQLPSVGVGAVLRDLIGSGVIPVTELTEIYRQGKDSNISSNAFRIRRGETNLTYGRDFVHHETPDKMEMESEMVETYCEKVQEYGIDDVKVIVPFNKDVAGVDRLNELIQERMNPLGGREEFVNGKKHFRVNDVVMQLENDRGSSIVNGDVGRVVDVWRKNGIAIGITVDFSRGITKKYTRHDIGQITLAYAYTVHRFQGSEAKCVITCVHSMRNYMVTRNLFYTAITRAQEEVHIFGQKSAVNCAIRTKDKKRFTLIKFYLQKAFALPA